MDPPVAESTGDDRDQGDPVDERSAPVAGTGSEPAVEACPEAVVVDVGPEAAVGARPESGHAVAVPRGRPLLAPAAALAAFLVACAVLSAGLIGWTDRRAGRTVIPPSAVPAPAVVAVADPSQPLARVAAVQPLLDRRAAAVREGRRADWAATLDPAAAAGGFRARQLAEYDRIRTLPVRTWRYQLLETTPAIGARGADDFVARVRLVYRLTGDTRDVEREQDLTVVRRASAWVIGAVGSGTGAADPWEIGPLTVYTGRRSVVIGIGETPVQTVRRTAEEADQAAGKVDDVWGTAWPRSAVLILPSDAAQFAALLGQGPAAGLDQVAAVTNGELVRDSVTTGAADRVVVNPEAFGRLSPLGRRVVLSHELTHVATRASARVAVPLWVEEGFANYVAYRGSGLARSLIAAEVLPLVRDGRAAARLPGAEAFDPSGGTIAPAYADAWLAFDLMASGDPAHPVAFYRVAAGLMPDQAGEVLTPEQTVPDAFRRVLGTDPLTFEVRWREHREALAGRGSR